MDVFDRESQGGIYYAQCFWSAALPHFVFEGRILGFKEKPFFILI